jgi:hypothetical protein
MSAEITAMLPTACRCGSIKGAIINGAALCACGAKRNKISERTTKFLAGIAEHFGEPTLVILRKPAARAAIAKQDDFLKRKRTSEGKTWFDIITNNLGQPADSNDFTVDPQQQIELLGIAPAPIDAGEGNDDPPRVEESEN